MTICFCLKTPAPFGYSPGITKAVAWACSLAHVELTQQNYRSPEAMSEIEEKARAKAGEVVGEYLEHLGKTDLAEFAPDEFDMLLKTVIESYKEAVDDLSLPF